VAAAGAREPAAGGGGVVRLGGGTSGRAVQCYRRRRAVDRAIVDAVTLFQVPAHCVHGAAASSHCIARRRRLVALHCASWAAIVSSHVTLSSHLASSHAAALRQAPCSSRHGACWVALPACLEAECHALGWSYERGGLHAAEHALISVAPAAVRPAPPPPATSPPTMLPTRRRFGSLIFAFLRTVPLL
jgi:hypothetical protein